MRALFPGHYRPSEDEFNKLWSQCTFVLDSNVLLNLYRYPENARSDFLKVLKNISNRIWIPHQVALEFQRNRLGVIIESLKPVEDLNKEVHQIEEEIDQIKSKIENSQKRGILGSIDLKGFAQKTREGLTDLKEKLVALEASQVKVFENDSIREEIENLVSGKVGVPSGEQKDLDEIYVEGEVRFKREIPPGYVDQSKEQTGGPDEFNSGGLVYKRKFGDLILWKQLIKYAKENHTEYIIFITDDRKEDWWWKEERKGEKKIGPRPELVEEITREAGVKIFYMYNPERFLEYAEKHLEVKVEEDTLVQIRELAKYSRLGSALFSIGSPLDAVFRWVRGKYPQAEIGVGGAGLGPNLEIYTEHGERIGYDVKVLTRPHPDYLIESVQSVRLYKNLGFDKLFLVLILNEEPFDPRIFENPASILLREGFDGFFCGYVRLKQMEGGQITRFKPVWEKLRLT